MTGSCCNHGKARSSNPCDMASRPLLSPLDEENTPDPPSCGPDGVNLTLGGSSDVETGLRESFIDVESRGINKKARCSIPLTSGKLFSYITKANGLWNPCKKPYIIFCAFFVVLNFLSLGAEIIIPSICGPFVDRCVTQKGRVTNATNNDNGSESNAAKIFEITLAFDAWNAFSDTMTYILLIYTLWRVQQLMPLLSLASAEAKVSSREWLFINVMLIICSVAITAACAYRMSTVESRKLKFYGTFGLGVLIVYLTAFICSCVFLVVTCALGGLVHACSQEICSIPNHATLDDIIAVHQKLCGQLATASQILAPWFLVHWLMFGVNCIAVFAFDSMYLGVLTHQYSGADTTFFAVSFVLDFLIFFVPCVFASRVTWKCEDILFKLNNMTAEDWNEGHPFRERTNVNAFLFYAERSKCGFRIRNITFGSSGTWISVLLGLLGFGLRFVQYIT